MTCTRNATSSLAHAFLPLHLDWHCRQPKSQYQKRKQYFEVVSWMMISSSSEQTGQSHAFVIPHLRTTCNWPRLL